MQISFSQYSSFACKTNNNDILIYHDNFVHKINSREKSRTFPKKQSRKRFANKGIRSRLHREDITEASHLLEEDQGKLKT